MGGDISVFRLFSLTLRPQLCDFAPMNQNKIFLSLLLLFVLSSFAMAKNVMWYNGVQPVTYSVNSKHSKPVKTALAMFSDDMEAVTGQPARHKKRNASLKIYQLDKLTNKEFKELNKLKLPLQRVITLREAFYIAVKSGSVVVVGSDALGTAYGILELSHMAGVSPWAWWGDVKPERKEYLLLDENFESLQSPAIPKRGISIDYERWSLGEWATRCMEKHLPEGTIGPRTYSQIFRLMLRLKANTLWPAYHEGEKDFFHVKGNKEVADSFGIHVENVRRKETSGNGTFHYRSLQHLGWPHDQLWLTTLSPGQESLDLRAAYESDLRQQWMVSIHDPKVSAYALSLFMDMAWNPANITPETIESHLERWLSQQFGRHIAQKLVPVMRQYYHLTSLRKPEYMGWNLSEADGHPLPEDKTEIRNTDFNPAAFGNELERYLVAYQALRQQSEEIAKEVSPELQDAYFAVVSYPIGVAAAMAEKQLQAQEARTIPREGQFLRDEEALTAAANSVKAYREILRLTQYYNVHLAGGKWQGLMNAQPRNLPVFAKPFLPGQLTSEMIDQYADPSYQYSPINQQAYGVVARNAVDFSSTNVKVAPIKTLGHSGKAVPLPGGTRLRYDFFAPKEGVYRLTLAFIPTQFVTNKSLRFQVKLDQDDPETLTLQLSPDSRELAESLLRGQAVKTLSVKLTKGKHTLVLQTIDSHLVFDQWMLDSNPERPFYVFPVY